MSAPRLFRPLLRVVLSLLLLAGIAAPLSALAAVVSFSQAGLPATPILQDGQAGSADIPGITLQVMNVASDSGGAVGTVALRDDATFFFTGDPSLRAVTHEDNDGYYGMAIKSSNARVFALKSLMYYNWGETSDANIRIRGYRAGSAVSGASYTFVWPANSTTRMQISLPAAFDQVDDVRVVISGGGANGMTSWHAVNDLDVTFTNSPPTAINLSNTSVMQSGGANAAVGTLTSTDADPGSTFTYSLVAGTGSTNNASFNIVGNVLRANSPASLPAGNYSVRVRTTDDAGGTFEQSFVVNVVDNVAATVTSIAPANSPAAAATNVDFTVTFSEAVTNVTVDDFLLITTSGNATGVLSSVSGSGTTYTVNVGSITGSGTLRVDLKSSNDIVDAGSNPTPGYTAGTTHTVLIPVAPGAPTITGVTPSAGQVVVSFSAPASDGGSPITGYTLTASPGGATLNGPGSPMTFTGLTNGTTYTFTVSATNNTGTSGPSAASAPVTPRVSQSITFNNPGAQD
ncbi:MAG: fibronectin type III domain-containing protein, partial [Stenotrophomonas sp.]